MSINTEIQNLHNRIDTCKRKLDAARDRGDQEMISKFTDEIEQVTKKLNQIKHKQNYTISKERKSLLDMPFSREITKIEQADLGQLKKRVRGIVIVHPMTKIGKEMKLETMTGFAPKKF